MRGKVLSFAADSGTISAEDGNRYVFDTAQWKGTRPPSQGEEVDFEVGDAGKAHDIYSLRTSATVDFGAVGDQAKALLEGGTNSPIGARLMQLATGNLSFQLAVVVVLASLFLTFVKLGGAIAPGASELLPDHGIYRIVNLGDLIDYLNASLTTAASALDQLKQLTSGNAMAGGAPSPLGDVGAGADNLRSAAGFTSVLYLAYLAPIAALALIVQLIREKSARIPALSTGAGCVIAFGLLVAARSMIVGAIKQGGNPYAIAIASKAIAFGFGSYVILLCGLALLGLAAGVIRAPQRP